MDQFLTWFVPTLKFAAIFISGASGILALLVEFKDDQHRITKWGRRAVIIVVVSFLVSAIMQVIEIHQDHEKEIAENNKTQNILNNINRQLYNINVNDISFDVTSELDMRDPVLQPYYQKLKAFCQALLTHPHSRLPKGVDTSLITNTATGKKQFNGLTIEPGSSLYPDSIKDKEAYRLIGRIMLDIKLFKYDTVKNALGSHYSLSFSTLFGKPRLWFTLGNATITMSIDGLRIPATDYAWRNQGDVQSLLDLAKGRIIFCYGDQFINDLSEPATATFKKIKLSLFSFNIAGRRFSSGDFCTIPGEFPDHYLDLPAEILATHLNMSCK